MLGVQVHNTAITRYEENVKKLEDIFKVNDLFFMEESELLNMITKAVMPDSVKKAVRTRDEIG